METNDNDIQCCSSEPQVLEIDEYERMLADGSLTAEDPVIIIIPAGEYRRRGEAGALPNHPIMREYGLRPYLDKCRRIEEEVDRECWESSVCGRVSGALRGGFKRLFS